MICNPGSTVQWAIGFDFALDYTISQMNGRMPGGPGKALIIGALHNAHTRTLMYYDSPGAPSLGPYGTQTALNGCMETIWSCLRAELEIGCIYTKPCHLGSVSVDRPITLGPYSWGLNLNGSNNGVQWHRARTLNINHNVSHVKVNRGEWMNVPAHYWQHPRTWTRRHWLGPYNRMQQQHCPLQNHSLPSRHSRGVRALFWEHSSTGNTLAHAC